MVKTPTKSLLAGGTKTQASIKSFFGLGAASNNTNKRKAESNNNTPSKNEDKLKKSVVVVVEKEEEQEQQQEEEEVQAIKRAKRIVSNEGEKENENGSQSNTKEPEPIEIDEDSQEEEEKLVLMPKRKRLRKAIIKDDEEEEDEEKKDLLSNPREKIVVKTPTPSDSDSASDQNEEEEEEEEEETTITIAQNRPDRRAKEKTKEMSMVLENDTEDEEDEEYHQEESEEENSSEESDSESESDENSISDEEQNQHHKKKNQVKSFFTPTSSSTSSSTRSSKSTTDTDTSSFTKKTPSSTSKSSSTTLATATSVTSTTSSTIAEFVLTTVNNQLAYCHLARIFGQIEEMSSRLEIQDVLTRFFRQIIHTCPQDLLACIYLCVCTDLAPPFENVKIGIGDAILMKSIGEATGTSLKFIKEMYQKEGDLGKVAQNSRSKQRTLMFQVVHTNDNTNQLTVQQVYQTFCKIAQMTGNNSQAQKSALIKNLLVKSVGTGEKKTTNQKKEEAKYLIRGLQGKLRIGLSEKTILMGLTYAFLSSQDAADKEKQEKALALVKRAFSECPSYPILIQALFQIKQDKDALVVQDFTLLSSMGGCVLTPGTPVSPMLARPTKSYAMVFDRFEKIMPFTCEYKYDGERAQIHYYQTNDDQKGNLQHKNVDQNGNLQNKIAIFSRNFENSTERFPDVKLILQKIIQTSSQQVTSCILDTEVVAIDKATNQRLPFQILSTRSRKNVKVEEIKVPVCVYAFDLLYLNGKSLLTESLETRRQLLKEHFHVEEGNFELATSMDVVDYKSSSNADEMEFAVNQIRTFLEQAVKDNCEGLMVKTLRKEATYEPANRSHKWLKLKKDYLDGIGDSTDLVPIGAFYGRGKRTGVYGAYLLACYDPETETYQAITKLGTGLSDEMLKQFYEQLKEKVVQKIPSDYCLAEGINPDVWFEPSTVWEILGADLSISPKYTAAIGLVDRNKGISLRFPRFLRVREDKTTTQATSSSQIADLYRAQGLATATNGEEEEDDDMML